MNWTSASWVAVCAGLVVAGASSTARADQISFVTKFNAPGDASGTTFARGINNAGVIVGDYVDGSGHTVAFERSAAGVFSGPIVAPGDNTGFTSANEINLAGTIVGSFLQSSGNVTTFHGYFDNGGSFTQFDVGGPVSTNVLGINDGGDFVGNYGSSVQPNQSYMVIGGTLTKFTVLGAPESDAEGINSSRQVVGVFTDSLGLRHGYLRQANGTEFQLDVPGAILTEAFGINDSGIISGEYEAPGGTFSAFAYDGGTFTSFSCPSSASTLGRRLNNSGAIVGQCSDPGGFIAQFSATSVPEPGTLALLGTGLLGVLIRRRRSA